MSERSGNQQDKSASVARNDGLLQPHPTGIVVDLNEGASPLAHVVLYQPEIPQNTGHIGRTCVATGAELWIVRPTGFRLDDQKLRRAGLDYWQHLRLHDVDNWAALKQQLPASEERRYWYLSRFAQDDLWDAPIRPGDVFVFGSETKGLPQSIHEEGAGHRLRLPTNPQVRSLNLASTVAIVLYEVVRRNRAIPTRRVTGC